MSGRPIHRTLRGAKEVDEPSLEVSLTIRF